MRRVHVFRLRDREIRDGILRLDWSILRSYRWGGFRACGSGCHSKWRSTMMRRVVIALAAVVVLTVGSGSIVSARGGGGHGGGMGHGGAFGGGGFGLVAMGRPGGFAAVHPMGLGGG